MDPAVLSALSAVMGSLVGGSATFATAWITQTAKNKQEMMAAEIRKREQLYGEFISECSKLAVDALDHGLDSPAKLLEVYALQNRIRLSASDDVVHAADRSVHQIVKQYFGPNVVLDDLRKISTEAFDNDSFREDPLKPFAAACRIELAALFGSV